MRAPAETGTSTRRRRYWVCAACASPRLTGIWDGYETAYLDHEARTLRVGQTISFETHQPDSAPETGSLQCEDCGHQAAKRALMSTEQFQDVLAAHGMSDR